MVGIVLWWGLEGLCGWFAEGDGVVECQREVCSWLHVARAGVWGLLSVLSKGLESFQGGRAAPFEEGAVEFHVALTLVQIVLIVWHEEPEVEGLIEADQ